MKGTAKESFFSYLEAQGIYFENPLGEKPKTKTTPYVIKIADASELKAWQEAEEKVWIKERCYIFEIV